MTPPALQPSAFSLPPFFASFALIADAPNGVAKLRELILTLAVQGKLVDRVPSEGDSQALVAEISQERSRLAQAGGGKLGSVLPEVDSPPQLAAVPAHWRWVLLGNLASKIGSGSTPRGGSKVYATAGIPFLRSQNIWNDGMRLDDVVYIDPDTHEAMRNTHVRPNDILLNITGASLGRCAIVPADFPAANVSQHVTIIRPLLAETRHFVRICLLSPFGQGMIWGRQVGVAREGLSKKVLEQFEIPLPPLAEQKRIVAKVEELMAVCDRLAAQQAERDRVAPLLARVCHAKFAANPTAAGLERIFAAAVPLDPGELRKTVLTLAVQGKLVPQDPEDEPASFLVAQILLERKKLARTTATAVRVIGGPDTLGYDIPKTWKWQTLEDILLVGPTNGISPKAVDYETPVRSLTLSATTSGRFIAECSKFITTEVPFDSDLWLSDGDILVQRGNSLEYVGVAAVYRGPGKCFVYPDLMMKIRISSLVDVCFVHLAMSQETARDFLRARASGTSGSMPKINHSTLKSLPLPLPPLAEQRRIVAKVDELMALIDRLAAQQQEKETLAEAFAEAAVAAVTHARMEKPEIRITT